MQSREVVQTFDRTSVCDRAAFKVWDFGNPTKIQDRTQKRHVLVPPNAKRHAYKIIVLCYLNRGIGSINIPTEDLSCHKLFFLNRRR